MVPERLRKRRRLSPPDNSSFDGFTDGHNATQTPLKLDNYLANASRWNLEQAYESKPRQLNKKEKVNNRLPIKTAEGRIEQVEPLAEAEEDGDSWLASEEEAAEDAKSTEEVAIREEPQKSSREQVLEAKEELARLALSINQNPEEHAGAFRGLVQWIQSPNHVVKQLAIATLLSVFKDAIPGYRIRPLSDKDMTEKVSKEVKQRRASEQALVRSYKKYVDTLNDCVIQGCKAQSAETSAVARTALSCACELLLAVPHFNFRADLIQVLANKLGQRIVDDEFTRCCTTLETLFQEDEDGNASHDAVIALTKMMKVRNYRVDESVLNTFLQLRLLTELSSKASKDAVDKDGEGGSKGKKPKQKREFRTKKQRKALKELKGVEKDFREADAVVSHEERDRLQGETLKLVFTTYFRILKARSPHLTGAVLEGLAKFAHLINQDFFGDLLEVFRELTEKAVASLDPTFSSKATDDVEDLDQKKVTLPMDPTRTALLCTTTAFSLLSRQDASRLSLDLSSFTALLYTLLLPTLPLHPDLEFSHKTLRLSDPHSFGKAQKSFQDQSSPKINVSANSTLLLRALTATLTPRSTPPIRLASFTHRLMSACLHTPEKTSRAVIGLLAEIVRSQGRKIYPLWNSEERRGDGEYDPLGDMENCKPYCGSVWEGELLKCHFSQDVRGGAKELEKLVAGFV
ncbi:MAG: hypothetical protein LQ340_007226 [Diploschistes diacapsis]|nr:MAG: hypothetical protein LQ340_007226 [Diploschistes diacapsis]